MHEASLYDNNCFITLTYDDDHLPTDGSLHKHHYQKFMKRLRKKYAGKNIRYYHCGEYGDQTKRPHYHACIFNLDFSDRTQYTIANGVSCDTSEILTDIWGHGFVTVGDLTFESAAYVARYIMKKVNGAMAEEHYERVSFETGEVYQIQPEYTTMSRRPGIGSDWYEKYKDNVYPQDAIYMRRMLMNPPKFYDGRLELTDPDLLEQVKENRKKEMRKHRKDNTPDRLQAREKVKKAQVNQLKRNEV